MCESNFIARLPDEEDKENKLRLEAYGGSFLNDLGILGRETRVRLSNMMISWHRNVARSPRRIRPQLPYAGLVILKLLKPIRGDSHWYEIEMAVSLTPSDFLGFQRKSSFVFLLLSKHD